MHPQDTVGYWLNFALHSFVAIFSEVLRMHCIEQRKDYVITPTQWSTLALLCHADGQTIGTIVQELGVEYPTVTGVVKRLEQSGLVERIHDCKDRRVVKVFLTVEGRNIMCTLDPVVEQFNKQVVSYDQQQVLFEQLQRFIATVEAIMPDRDEVKR